MNRIVILQPSYIPWLGYFDQINLADTFVFYDDVQYTRRDWRNRNKIKNSSSQEQLLTIPVETKGRYNAPINQIPIKPTPWRDEHLKAIQFNYAKSAHFKTHFPLLEKTIQNPSQNLADYTIETTTALSELLGIKNTQFLRSSSLDIAYTDPTDHLLQICKKLHATHYFTGASAKNYLDEGTFSKHSITLEYQKYEHPTYTQLWPPFISHLSIIDLILNEGPDSLKTLSAPRP